MKIRKIAYLSTLFAFLLPALVVATVVISYTYPINVSSTTPEIYLAEGPNYPTASSLGLISIPSGSTTAVGSNSYIISGTTITIKAVNGAGNTYLLNVLEIINNTGLKVPTYIWINITTTTIPSGSSLYYSQGNEISFSGSTLTNGTATSPTQISLSSTSNNQIHLWQTSVYIAIVLGSTASGSATVTIQYNIQ